MCILDEVAMTFQRKGGHFVLSSLLLGGEALGNLCCGGILISRVDGPSQVSHCVLPLVFLDFCVLFCEQ